MADRSKEREKLRKKKKRASRRKFIIIMIMLISVAIGNPLRNYISLKIENRRLKERNEQLILQRTKLKEEYKNIDNREYVEKQAREQLRLANPEEIIFVFPEGEKKINVTTEDDKTKNK